MGGHALSCDTRRFQADEYRLLETEVLNILRRDFPYQKIATFPYYKNKPDFGDIDFVIETDNLEVDLRQYIIDTFSPKDIIVNGDAISFEYKGIQVDLNCVSSLNFQSTLDFNSWNGLCSSIICRLASVMGFKLSPEGFSTRFVMDNYCFAELHVSRDTAKILEFLGYDPKPFYEGFATLEDVFAYSVSSPYFDKKYFEVKNNQDRTNVAKRKMYREFLEWLDTVTLPKRKYSESLKRAFVVFPEFKTTYDNTMVDYNDWKMAKEVFNGKLVSEWTGLTDKDLGLFMKTLKELGNKMPNFNKWVVNTGTEGVKTWVLEVWNS